MLPNALASEQRDGLENCAVYGLIAPGCAEKGEKKSCVFAMHGTMLTNAYYVSLYRRSDIATPPLKR
jgi:hypothetical protein